MFDVSTSAPPDDRLGGFVHGYFELTYASYFVAERSVLATAGVDDRPLRAVLNEMWAAYRHIDLPVYRIMHGRWGMIEEFSDEQLATAGITPQEREQGEGEGDDDHREQLYSDGWDELTSQDYAFIPSSELLPTDAAIVAPRTLLQSMPNGWQERFVAIAKELEKAVGGPLAGETKVIAGRNTEDGIVSFHEDPIPYYRRGRTYVEPRI